MNECVTSDRTSPSPPFCLPQLAHLEMGLLGFASLTPSSFSGACAHTCVKSPIILGRGPRCLHPLLQPQTPNYLQMVLSWSFPSCPMCSQTPPPLNDTLLPSTEGGEGAGATRLWFLFPLRQASGSRIPALLPGWHQGPLRSLPVPTSDTMCSPFRGSRSFLPEGELEVGALPLVGRSSLPRPPFIRAAFLQLGLELTQVELSWASLDQALMALPSAG